LQGDGRRKTLGNALDVKEAYAKLTLAFKALGGGLWEYDIDADVIRCNRRWYEILGLEEGSSPIRSIQDFRPYIHPDDVELATRVDLDLVSQWLANDEIYHVDFRIIRPDNCVRWLRSVACLTRDTASNHRTAIGCVTDVTDLQPFETIQSPDRITREVQARARVPLQERGGHLPVKLTRREKECLMWVSLGKTASETGSIIGNSQRTVEFHLNNAVRKLKATNKIHAAALAIRAGLI
jgi:DNA-binding CsgD family transcriptional regulator